MLKYHPSSDLSMIAKAYQVASRAHEGQVRKSGEPYIIHPPYVGIILADLELDKETIAGKQGFCMMSLRIRRRQWMIFDGNSRWCGSSCDGVTKLGQIDYSADKVEVQAENLRKMFLAMAKDIRVILIKLADRL